MPKFELGEAVWAKLGGDPYWPALVWPFDRVGADVKRHREPGTTLVRFFDGGENPFGFPLEIHVKPWKGVHFAEHASIRRVKRATEECQFHVENGRTMDDIQGDQDEDDESEDSEDDSSGSSEDEAAKESSSSEEQLGEESDEPVKERKKAVAKRPKKIRQIARKEKKRPKPAVSKRVAKARKVSATATASRSAANQASTASSGTPRVDITALRRKRAAEKLKMKKSLKAQRARAQAAAGNREELLTKAEMIALMEKARSRGPGEMERWLARLLNRFDKRIKAVTQKCDEMQRKSESNQRKIAERELKLKEDEKTILKMKEEVAGLRKANDQAARA